MNSSKHYFDSSSSDTHALGLRSCPTNEHDEITQCHLQNNPLEPNNSINVRRLTFSLEIFSGHVVLHFDSLINRLCCCLFSESIRNVFGYANPRN